MNKTATVSLASDDAYSTDANGVVTKAPSSGTGAFNYFSAQLPVGAPAVGSTKTPSDATATTTSVPFGALIGGWSAMGSATPPKTPPKTPLVPQEDAEVMALGRQLVAVVGVEVNGGKRRSFTIDVPQRASKEAAGPGTRALPAYEADR